MKQFKRVDVSGEGYDASLTVKDPKIVELAKKFTEGQLKWVLHEMINGFGQSLMDAQSAEVDDDRPLTTYFAGPMEFAKGSGADWRNRLTKSMEERDIVVKNPCKIETQDTGHSLRESHRLLQQAKENQDWETLNKFMNPTEDRDFKAIEESDFVVMYLDHSSGPGGTYCELEHCKELGIPVYGVCTTGFGKENSWILHVILNTGGKLFTTFEDLLRFIDKTYFEGDDDELRKL